MISPEITTYAYCCRLKHNKAISDHICGGFSSGFPSIFGSMDPFWDPLVKVAASPHFPHLTVLPNQRLPNAFLTPELVATSRQHHVVTKQDSYDLL